MKKAVYLIIMCISTALIVLSLTVFSSTKWLGGIIIGIGIYLFLGSLIKLCRMNEKLKNTVICAIDLLFWLP